MQLAVKKPKILCCFIIFFALMLCHCMVVILVISLNIMPPEFSHYAFFRNTSFLVKFLGDFILASLIITSLYQMKQSAIFWCLALLLFDVSSVLFWVLTQNWIEAAGSQGIFIVSLVWSGCISAVFYLKYLQKHNRLRG